MIKNDCFYKNLVSEYGSPFYILDENILRKRVQEIRNRLPENAKLCYAIKANAFILDSLKNEDILFEVCSPGELSICEELKVSPEKIVFSGVCKTLEDIKRAYNLKVDTITLESKTHCDYLLQTLKTENIHQQKVILRYSSGNQFGMSQSDLEECIEKLKKENTIIIGGIHYFSGTQKKLKVISEEITKIEHFCKEIEINQNISLDYIEYGPGLSFDYFSKENEAENYTEIDNFVSLIKSSERNYVIELGRYIASSCGKYVTKIMDVKKGEKGNYLIIDGGINHINYYGQMMGMKNPEVEHIKINKCDDENNPQNWTIAGSLCTTADIVLRQLPLNNPKNGDLLVFSNIGAYSITEGIYLFLSHPLPCIILKNNNDIKLLRKSKEIYKLNF